MSNLQWDEQYGVSRAKIGELMNLSIEFTKEGYVVSIVGYLTIRLKPVSNREQAKRNAVTFALKELKKYTQLLESEQL